MVKSKFVNFIKRYWHIIFLCSFVFLPLFWYWGKGTAIINGVDTNFPLNPTLWLIRRFYMWNNLSNGGSDFSFAPAGIFFHIIQFIPYVLGLGLQLTQKISLVFWFGLIVVNSYIFSGNFIKNNKLLKILFVCLYSLNIYMFNSWENVKVANLSLVAAMPLLLHVFINLKDGIFSKSKSAVLLVITSFILSGAGINPAYFITAVISIFIFSLSFLIVGEDFKNISKSFLFIVGIILLISSYWVIPTISFVLRSVAQNASIGSIGFNNWIDSLSENTSIINILRLQGAWDWYSFDIVSKAPLYLPYTPNYFLRISFILFSFVVPIISLLSLTFINKTTRKYHLAFVIMLLLGIFLGAGTHEPTGILFKWLSLHLSYFSLFRSPWYIFTSILTLSLSALTVLFFNNFKPTKITNFLVVLLIIGNFVYCYPLVTGRIFRPNKPDGFFVNFPRYVFDAGNKLSNLTNNRIISYPDDQLEKFNWGYIGVEPVINLFSDNEMVFSGINNTLSSFSQIVDNLYKNLKIGNNNAVTNLAQKINSDTILEKNDQQTLSPKIETEEDWNTLKFKNWNIHKFDDDKSNTKISLANTFYFDYSKKTDKANQLGLFQNYEHLINSNDSIIQKIGNYVDNAGTIVFSDNFQVKNYILTNNKKLDFSYVDFEFSIPKDGWYHPVLDRYGLSQEDLNNFYVFDGIKNILFDFQKLDDSYVYFDKVYLKQGDYRYRYNINSNLVFNDDFDEMGGTLDLVNLDDFDKNYNINIPNMDINIPYYISFEYLWKSGNYPLVLLNQFNDQTLFKTDKIVLDSYTDKKSYSFYFTPVQTKSKIELTFVAQKIDSEERTSISYDNLKIYKLFMNNLYFINNSNFIGNNAEIEFNKISPVKYVGSVKNIKNPQTLIFAENYSDGWKIKITDIDDNKIQNRADHFTVDLYANAWYIDTLNKDFKFEIYYDPQKYFNFGVVISLISISTIVFLYLSHEKRHKN